MFDRIKLSTEVSQHPSHIDVYEHRAPTADTAKFLKELEDKAKDNILKSIRIENNSFNCVVHYQMSSLMLDHIFIIIFKLNNVESRVEVVFRDFEITQEKIIKGIRDAVAEEISNKMLCSIYKELNRIF